MRSDAVLSPCGLYRYRLSREWSEGPKLAFVMLNPSTADAELNDPTIRRCMRFAHEAGYGGLTVGNLFALRATSPKALRAALDPVGPLNDTMLAAIIAEAALVVCAWGASSMLRNRDHLVIRMIQDSGKVPHCLRMTANGYPGHPLYVHASMRPKPFG